MATGTGSAFPGVRRQSASGIPNPWAEMAPPMRSTRKRGSNVSFRAGQDGAGPLNLILGKHRMYTEDIDLP